MKFLPYEKFIVETNLPGSEVYKLLKGEVRSRGYVLPKEKRAKGLGKIFSYDRRRFKGKIDRKGFYLRKRFPLFSRGHPQIFGKFEPGQHGMDLYVEVGHIWAQNIVAVILLLLFFLSVYMTFFAGLEFLHTTGWNIKTVRSLVVIPGVVWFAVMIPFWVEVGSIKGIFNNIFDQDKCL